MTIRRERSSRALLAVAVAVLATTAPLSAARDTGVVSRELSLARQSVILGNTDEAIGIYKRILRSHPEEERALWGLARVYASEGMDREELIPLLRDWLESHPDDPRAKLELGSAFARIGDSESAHRTWTAFLHEGEPDAARYSEVGALELRHGMLEDSAETYLEARRALEEPELFAEDLVAVYTDLGRYESALTECLVAVREHPGVVQWAVNRLELMLEQGADRRDVERSLSAAARADGASPSVLSFVGSSYIVLDMPGRALEAFLLADEASPDDGRALLDHSAILADAGMREQAREALSALVERHAMTMTAARAGVELGLDLAREGRVDDALDALRATGERYTQFSEGGEALLEAARLELGELGDPDAAMATISDVLDEGRSKSKRLIEESMLLRVDVLMAKGEFEDAHSSAEELLSGRLHKDIEARALYARAFSSFLAHERRRALDEFREMIEGDPSGDLVNDALRVMLVIAEAEESLGSGPATLLADAHSAFLMGDRAAGRTGLREIVDDYPGTAVATEGLLLLGAIASAEGDNDAALDAYARTVSESESLTARAEALMRSGDILLHEFGRPYEALEKYALILETLPANALSGEARRKIEAIREEGRVEG